MGFKKLAMWSGIFTAIFLAISFTLRYFLELQHFKIFFHHGFYGLIIIIFILIARKFSDKLEKLYTDIVLGFAIGLILSDILHHIIFKVPWSIV